MSYRVIIPFTDAQDNDFAYGTNDEYPRKGYTPSKSRIKDLLNGTNRRNKPLIVEEGTKEEVKEEVKQETSDDVTGGYGY